MSNAAGRSAVLVPGVALAAAGMVALSPVVLSASPGSSAMPRPALPAMHIDDINLTGIGQDIYYAITPGVQYVVGGVSYLINFIPLIGGPIAAQININYFQGIQPVVEATVNYLAAVVQDPLNFIASTQAYGATLYDIGYNWVSAELMFLGLQPLPPLPQSAAAAEARGPRAAAATAAEASAESGRGGVAVTADAVAAQPGEATGDTDPEAPASGIDGVAVSEAPGAQAPHSEAGDAQADEAPAAEVALNSAVQVETPAAGLGERARTARSAGGTRPQPRTAEATDAAIAEATDAATDAARSAGSAAPADQPDSGGQRTSARISRGA